MANKHLLDLPGDLFLQVEGVYLLQPQRTQVARLRPGNGEESETSRYDCLKVMANANLALC